MSQLTYKNFWFNPNPKLAIACGIVSYGECVDEMGNVFISAVSLQGEKFQIYGTSKEERNEKYHTAAFALIRN